MIDFIDKYTENLHEELLQRFIKNGKLVTLGNNRSGNPKAKTQEFLDFLDTNNISIPPGVKTSQMLAILYHEYTDDDVLCPECGSFKHKMFIGYLPVYCSTA